MLMERLGPIKPAPVRCLRDAMGNWLFVFSPCLEIGLETDLVVDNVTVIEILHDKLVGLIRELPLGEFLHTFPS
ncbi:hypothetical protein V6N12_068880 [Hibiscus sabdariffa]|uniref:Uncharacterized protein n=1 Tax=Hibiscus sabdariffa TaxID=183260 RepID=A0ABR2CA44_9ROSI